MPIRIALGLLVAALSLSPPAALAQRPMELADAEPQPHFVAAWAPKKQREAERSAVLVQRVSLELTDAPLDLALKTLTQRAGLNITYSPAVLPAGKRVTLAAGDIAVVTALTEMLFKSGLDVVVDRDGAMALVLCKHPAPRVEIQDSGTIVGTVTDKASGAPIVGATVLVEGAKLTTTTGSDGQYRVENVQIGTWMVRVRYIGYAPLEQTIVVPGGGEVTADFRLERSVQRLDDVVTTGTIVPTHVKALPMPVSIISSSFVEARRPRSVTQLVRHAVPSAIAWDNSPFPTNTVMTVRGASSFTVGSGGLKVYLDGVELSNFLSAPIDPSTIERVEIVRGPQAATIYGSDAINGVMQVFTRRGDSTLTRPQIDASAEVGAAQSPHGDAIRQAYKVAVSGGKSTASYNLGLGYSRTGEWFPEGVTSEPSVYSAARLVQGPVTLDITGRYLVQNSAFNPLNPEVARTGLAFFSAPFFQPYRAQQQTLGVRLAFKPTSWWQHTMTAGLDQFDQHMHQEQPRLTFPSDTLLAIYEPEESKASILYNTTAAFRVSPDLNGTVTIGFDHQRRTLGGFYNFATATVAGTVANATGIRELITNTGYFAQTQFAFRGALFLTAGLRGDRNSSFGGNLRTPMLPRLGVAFANSLGMTEVKLRASWGEAIRSPSPNQKVASAGGLTLFLANPGLGPERQKGWDTGVDVSLGVWGSFSATYFDQEANDLIQPVQISPGPPVTQQYRNIGRVRNTGAEFEAKASFGAAELTAQYAYTRSRVRALAPTYDGDLRVGDQSLATPEHTAGAMLDLPVLQGTRLAAGVTYLGSWNYYDFLAQMSCLGGTGVCHPNPRDYLIRYPALLKANLSLTQKLTPLLSAFLSIDNVTNNSSYEVWNAIAVMGRITTVGLSTRY